MPEPTHRLSHLLIARRHNAVTYSIDGIEAGTSVMNSDVCVLLERKRGPAMRHLMAGFGLITEIMDVVQQHMARKQMTLFAENDVEAHVLQGTR